MLPITTVIYASLHNVQHVAISGILPCLLRLLALTANQQRLCILSSLTIIILMLVNESLSLMRSTQSLSYIPLCRVCIMPNSHSDVKSRKRHCL